MFEAFSFASGLWDHACVFHKQQVVGDVISADIEHPRNIALWECIFHWILHYDGANIANLSASWERNFGFKRFAGTDFGQKIVNKMAFIRDKAE